MALLLEGMDDMNFFKEFANTLRPRDDDDNDFFEDADEKFRPAPPAAAASAAQLEFESTFGQEPSANPEPERRSAKTAGDGGSLFGNLGGKRAAKPHQRREKVVNFNGRDTQVILFNPKSCEEALELVNYLKQGRSVILSLEGAKNMNGKDSEVRMLDFLTGMTYALEGKLTPVAKNAYFITPHNVDLLNAQDEQPLNEGDYF